MLHRQCSNTERPMHFAPTGAPRHKQTTELANPLDPHPRPSQLPTTPGLTHDVLENGNHRTQSTRPFLHASQNPASSPHRTKTLGHSAQASHGGKIRSEEGRRTLRRKAPVVERYVSSLARCRTDQTNDRVLESQQQVANWLHSSSKVYHSSNFSAPQLPSESNNFFSQRSSEKAATEKMLPPLIAQWEPPAAAPHPPTTACAKPHRHLASSPSTQCSGSIETWSSRNTTPVSASSISPALLSISRNNDFSQPLKMEPSKDDSHNPLRCSIGLTSGIDGRPTTSLVFTPSSNAKPVRQIDSMQAAEDSRDRIASPSVMPEERSSENSNTTSVAPVCQRKNPPSRPRRTSNIELEVEPRDTVPESQCSYFEGDLFDQRPRERSMQDTFASSASRGTTQGYIGQNCHLGGSEGADPSTKQVATAPTLYQHRISRSETSFSSHFPHIQGLDGSQVQDKSTQSTWEKLSSRFGRSSRRSKSQALNTSQPDDASRHKCPTAGTGHEGYGKYARRGRKFSVSSIGGSSKRDHSTSSNRSGSVASSGRCSNQSSGLESASDDLLKRRFHPTVIKGNESDGAHLPQISHNQQPWPSEISRIEVGKMEARQGIASTSSSSPIQNTAQKYAAGPARTSKNSLNLGASQSPTQPPSRNVGLEAHMPPLTRGHNRNRSGSGDGEDGRLGRARKGDRAAKSSRWNLFPQTDHAGKFGEHTSNSGSGRSRPPVATARKSTAGEGEPKFQALSPPRGSEVSRPFRDTPTTSPECVREEISPSARTPPIATLWERQHTPPTASFSRPLHGANTLHVGSMAEKRPQVNVPDNQVTSLTHSQVSAVRATLTHAPEGQLAPPMQSWDEAPAQKRILLPEPVADYMPKQFEETIGMSHSPYTGENGMPASHSALSLDSDGSRNRFYNTSPRVVPTSPASRNNAVRHMDRPSEAPSKPLPPCPINQKNQMNKGVRMPDRSLGKTSMSSSSVPAVQTQIPSGPGVPPWQSNTLSSCTVSEDGEKAGQADLRFAALMTSKWLSFGRILFSPAHELVQDSLGHQILIIDGLSNDDWSLFCAATYPRATIHALHEGDAVTGSMAGRCRSFENSPPNHHQAHVPSLAGRFPFPSGLFTAVVVRFPALMSDRSLKSLLSECKRVLVPGGYIELSLLDLDIDSMGTLTRRAVRDLKAKIISAEPHVSLKPVSDSVQCTLGQVGFENLNRCTVGTPVNGKVVSGSGSPSSTQSSRASSRQGDRGDAQHMHGNSISQDSESSPDLGSHDAGHFVLDELVSDHSARSDEKITRLMAKVGRWWYTHIYESTVLESEDSRHSMWNNKRLLRECRARGSGFKLLIAYAQTPVQARPRSMSEPVRSTAAAIGF